MDSRPVIKLEANTEWEWMCPECQMIQILIELPTTPDLTCQDCGANFKNGGEA